MTTHEDALADAQDDAAFAAACCSRMIGDIELSPVIVEDRYLADVVAVVLADQTRMSCQWTPGADEDTVARQVIVNDVVVPVVEEGDEFVADLSNAEPSFRERYAGALADIVAVSDTALAPTTREVFNEKMRQFRDMTAPSQVAVLNCEFEADEAMCAGWIRAHQDVVDDLNEVAANAVHV